MHTNFLIVGAGPFGLAMSAQAKSLGVDHVVVGEPLSFWKRHMPEGMLLRSGIDWHLDPLEEHTLARYIETRGLSPADVEPISLDFYLEYARWFMESKDIRVQRSHIVKLERHNGRFIATTDDGSEITADKVLLALGFAPFAHVPAELATMIPADHSTHTRDVRTPSKFAGKRILMVGGRQSAFETAALLAEAGASEVHVCHRHATPTFTESDWSWVGALLKRIADEPTWYRSLPPEERAALDKQFWREGRLKLEPWLGPRVQRDAITIRAKTTVVGCKMSGPALHLDLNNGKTLEIDHVVYATGYRADVRRIPLLKGSTLLDQIEHTDGFPVLDETMRSSVPGLHFTSLTATRDFGLFFAFTAAARASARIISRAL